MLALGGVTKRFGKTTAVSCANLDLLPGERLCVLGPNGAGKTTLMRMIVGMARADEGSVLFLGSDPAEVPAVRRHLGYLSDKPYVYDKLTCLEHLRLHAAIYGLPTGEIAEAGLALLAHLGMGEVLDQRAETFSLGMQKKLALTLALAHRPDLLVLDEPLNGLDPASAEKMEVLLRRHAAEDGAVILSTHSVEFASRFATHFATMFDGRLSMHAPQGKVDVRWTRGLLSVAGKEQERA